jgi:hypothetical protein
MKTLKTTIVFVALSCLLTFCKKDISTNSKWTNNTEELYKHNDAKTTILEGIAGTLTLIEGNCMPPIGANSSCKEYPVKRKIRMYEYTLLKQAKNEGGAVFTDVSTKLLATVDCDEEGFYQIKLPPLRYSLFIEENGKLYANGLDGYGGINPVTVDTMKVSKTNLKISYAVY